MTKICRNKECVHTGVEQPIENFYKNESGRDGYQAQCKNCVDKSKKKNMKKDNAWMSMIIG